MPSCRYTETKIECLGNVSKHVLHCSEMFGGWCLHEPTDVTHSVGDIRPSVNQVPETPHDAPIESGIHRRTTAGLAQSEPCLHRYIARTTAHHSALLQDPERIGSLVQRDATIVLVHLDSEVVAEQSQITHLEYFHHLILELGDLWWM